MEMSQEQLAMFPVDAPQILRLEIVANASWQELRSSLQCRILGSTYPRVEQNKLVHRTEHGVHYLVTELWDQLKQILEMQETFIPPFEEYEPGAPF